MSEAAKPAARLNLEYLKKLAKKRLKALRMADGRAKLADAQLEVARENGFSSWRKLKAHVEAQPATVSVSIEHLLKAIAMGELKAVNALLALHPGWVNEPGPHPHWGGRPQPLHVAIEAGTKPIFDLLLKAGADINSSSESYGRWTPLMLTVNWNRTKMRDALLKRKARVGLIEALMLEDDRAMKRILRADRKSIARPMPNEGTPLHFARTPLAVGLLLDAGVDPSKKDRWGKTAVEAIAARGSSAKPLVRLLKDRAGAHVPPTALAAVGDVALLSREVRKDASIARDPALIHSAAEHKQFFTVFWLLKHGADVNARSQTGSRGTLLHTSAWAGDIRTVRLLVESGAAIDAIDEEHRNTPAGWARTALDRFKRRTCKAVAEYLETVARSRKAGSTTPPPRKASSDWKPIMDAAFLGDAKKVKALLDAGADPNVVSKTAHRYRPLHRAIEHKKTAPKTPGHDEVVKVLLAGGADPKLRGTHGQVTALELACTNEPRFIPLLIAHFKPLDIFHACACADEKRVRDLLKNDSKLANVSDTNNWTPLLYCAASRLYREGHSAALAKIAQLLLDQGADPSGSIKVEGGWSLPALYFAAGHADNAAVAEVLLKAGANPCDGESVYHAADEGHEQCLKLFERYTKPADLARECTMSLCNQMHWGRTRGAPWLLEHGADPNDLGRWGDAALHSAVKNRANDKIIRLLLKSGANPKLKNKEGKTPSDLAKELGVDRIMPLLL